MVRLRSISLPNLMSDRRVFPEMVSVGSADPAVEFLTTSIGAMLADDYYYRRTVAQLAQLREQFAMPGASQRAARWICGPEGIGSGAADEHDRPQEPPRALPRAA